MQSCDDNNLAKYPLRAYFTSEIGQNKGHQNSYKHYIWVIKTRHQLSQAPLRAYFIRNWSSIMLNYGLEIWWVALIKIG